jgi:hypothetical protein
MMVDGADQRISCNFVVSNNQNFSRNSAENLTLAVLLPQVKSRQNTTKPNINCIFSPTEPFFKLAGMSMNAYQWMS